MKTVAAILRLIANLIDKPMATPFTLGITTDVGAVANFLEKCAEIGLDVEKVFDDPRMVARRDAVARQKQHDQNAKDVDEALSTGDATKVNQDLS